MTFSNLIDSSRQEKQLGKDENAQKLFSREQGLGNPQNPDFFFNDQPTITYFKKAGVR